MNKPLLSKFKDLEGRCNNLQAENIRFYHGLGELVLEIKKDPGKYVGNDGTEAMELIEKALFTQARTLRHCASFATAYTAAEMEDLATMHHNDTNFHLHWGHIKLLLTVTDKKKREEFADEAVSRMWDPGTLHDRIKKAEGRVEGHGRKHTLPHSIEAQVRQFLEKSKEWMGKQKAVWNGTDVNVFTNINDAPKGQLTPEVLEGLNELHELMLDMADAATANVGHIERAVTHVTAIVQEKQAANVNKRAASTRSRRDIDLAGAET